MTHTNGSPESLEKHQQEVCGAFARAAVAMRDAAQTAENFSNWFSRVNNLQNVPVPPMFNGSHNVASQIPGLPQNSEAEKTGKKRKTSGDPEGKKKRPAREKKPIDPNAPKRPPSAYLLFQNDVRKAVKDQHPDMPYNQVLTEVSKLWHALTSEERAPYMQATADSKDIYKKAKADYDALSPTEAKDVKEASAKPSPSKSKAPAVSATAEKPSAKDAATSDDDDEEETTSSSSDKTSEDDEDEDEEDEIVEEVPQPPRKKPKKEVVQAPSSPVKVVEKMKKKEGKEKKRK